MIPGGATRGGGCWPGLGALLAERVEACETRAA